MHRIANLSIQQLPIAILYTCCYSALSYILLIDWRRTKETKGPYRLLEYFSGRHLAELRPFEYDSGIA